MIPLPTVAVAIPAYNEADGIGGFLGDLDVVLAELASHHTFVIADDRSTDGTIDVIEEVRDELSGSLELVVADVNRGHGPTVVAAYERCIELSTDVVVQVDGDGQFDAEDLRLLFGEFGQGSDVVTGNRVARVDPWFRTVVTTGVRWLLRLLFGVSRRDSNCPFRLYRTTVLVELLAKLPNDPLVPHVELTVLESRAGVVVSDVDVRHLPRRGDGPGTMWQGRRRWSAVVRLARFCGRALVEVARFRRQESSRRLRSG